ncbi:anaphase-promoting complex subunit 7 isoform X4 [Desmodus rotundus]|uniref:anaphase-promoting complex subunit 7 isoform X4 n=1 Tax=Desmodus rotundus TaxID=9430 RepID=UPI001E1C1E31|nr:anaphase-promoting complex subunit 7 isoform X4 [Desmodus rotundus]
MNVIDHVRDMAAAGLHSNVRLLSSLLLTMSNNNPCRFFSSGEKFEDPYSASLLPPNAVSPVPGTEALTRLWNVLKTCIQPGGEQPCWRADIHELFSPSQKYQLLVYHADSLFHDKEYRNAVSKYTMALQQKKALSKTSKVRPSTGNSASTPQSQCLPSEIEVKYKMAECYTMLKQDKDAIAILDGIPSRQRTPKINMMLANLYKKAGQERPSVTSYKEVLRQCPLALDAILGLLSLSVKGAEVASMTMNVIQTVPNLDWLSVWIKAYAFVHTGDNSRAINTICSLEKKSLLRDNVDLLGSLADLYFRAGDNKNSVLKFEQAQMLDPYLIKGMDIYGYLLAREGRLEDVENLGCRLFNISDQHAEPWVVSGCHSFYSKRYSRALYLGAKAIQLNSNSVQALLLKGAALRNMGRVQEAIIHFREAIRLAPCRLDCYEGLIECYLASNSIREAMVMANNVYKTLGANAQTLTLLATVCLEDPVTQEKAKTLLDKALNQRPDYIKAVVKKAELLSREQKYEDGIALLRNALANQSDCVLHRILGDFLVAVNEYQEAMDQYSIALRHFPFSSLTAQLFGTVQSSGQWWMLTADTLGLPCA